MYLPQIPAVKSKVRRQTLTFGGLNYCESAQDGELADSIGISCGEYPVMTQRKGRHVERALENGSAIYAWGKLCYVDGTRLYYDGNLVGTVMAGKKQFAVVNTKLCIFPDKKYIDLSTTPPSFGDLEASATSLSGTTVTFTTNSLTMATDLVGGNISDSKLNFRPIMSRNYRRTSDGWVYYMKTYSNVTWNGFAWTKTGETEHTLLDTAGTLRSLVGRKVILMDTGYAGGLALNFRMETEHRVSDGSGTTTLNRETTSDYGQDNCHGIYGVITSVVSEDKTEDYYGNDSDPEIRYLYGYYASTFRVTVEVHYAGATNITFDGIFSPGDRVKVSGSSIVANNTAADKHIIVRAVSGRTITFDANTFTAGTTTNAVTVKRDVPDLDFICENGNRLWGVSNATRTIYASAWGDPKNFYLYDDPTVGNAELSYAVPVGTDGDFTGCIAYSGNILCWKENCLHKLLGTSPDNYELYTYQIAGVQAGSEKSMVIINEALYYKGRDGVYVFTGSTPQLVSYRLGMVGYRNAVGGTDGRAYYVSMERTDGQGYELLVYDPVTGLWCKEDALQARGMAVLNGSLYILTTYSIYKVGTVDDDGGPIPWMAKFTPFYEITQGYRVDTSMYMGRKQPSRIYLRLDMEPGTWVEVELALDGGPFKTICSIRDSSAHTALIPLRPGRCDSYQVRIHGEGRCIIRSMVREYTVGSPK